MAAIELLRGKPSSVTATAILEAFKVAALDAGDSVKETKVFEGGRDWLVLFGYGAEPHHLARNAQVKAGGRALLFDLGYWGRQKGVGYVKMTIDDDHPQRWLDRTPVDPRRWDALNIALRQDADTAGPVILVGMGRKARAYLKKGDDWERKAFERLSGRRVIYRPKTEDDLTRFKCERDATTPIETLLRGASLVVCRHSNCAVDAVVAGVPFEASDGAATWLQGKHYTPANRLDFCRRLAWWQWKPSEVAQAWKFAKEMASV